MGNQQYICCISWLKDFLTKLLLGQREDKDTLSMFPRNDLTVEVDPRITLGIPGSRLNDVWFGNVRTSRLRPAMTRVRQLLDGIFLVMSLGHHNRRIEDWESFYRV